MDGMLLLFILIAIMSSFMLFFIIDISYNLRRMNNNIIKLLQKEGK